MEKSDKFAHEMPAVLPVPLANSHPELMTKSPIELFDMIFTEEMFENLKRQFELYAHIDANRPAFSASVNDIRHFIGILLIFGYHCLPCERDYWSTADDLGLSACEENYDARQVSGGKAVLTCG